MKEVKKGQKIKVNGRSGVFVGEVCLGVVEFPSGERQVLAKGEQSLLEEAVEMAAEELAII